MFIFAGRGPGALAGLACAVLVIWALGGCASPGASSDELAARAALPQLVQCPAGTIAACAAFGPRREDARCGCEDPRAAEAALARLTRR